MLRSLQPAAACLAVLLAGVMGHAATVNYTPVFTPGELGYPCIRIPSLLLAGNTGVLLAFAECRNWTGDGCLPKKIELETKNSNRDLCLKTSTDNGATWGPLRVITRDASQPSPVWDAQRKQILLSFNKVSTLDNFQMISRDLGRTWSEPVNISAFLAPIGPFYVGPGVGIQLTKAPHAGRLVFIGHHGAYIYDGVWYSDDGGQTYTKSKSVFDKMDEPQAQLAELDDGRILATLRNNHINASCLCQGKAISSDGGETFSPVAFDPALITPVCMASLITIKDRVYFSNPDSATARVNGKVRLSTDGGATWPRSLSITAGDFAYSCLSPLSDPALIGLLWETGMEPAQCEGASCQTVFSALPAQF